MINSIFDRIVTNENSFIELFRNFLRFKMFRQSFLELIEMELEIEDISYEDFDTQLTISKFGRPDLALFTEDAEILFEIKVYNTAFTSNQPTSYYKYLRDESEARSKGLILIIPENYYDIESYKAKLEKIKKDPDNIHTQIILWESVCKLITESELERVSPLFYEYQVFITEWFQLRPIFYDNLNAVTMFGKQYPESLRKTMELIDAQFREFQKQGFEVKKSAKKDFSEYGFYFTMPDQNDELFFGIWFSYWETAGNPVCLALDSDSKSTIEEFKSAVRSIDLMPPTIHEDWYVSFINQNTLMEEKSGQRISRILSDIIARMGIEPPH